MLVLQPTYYGIRLVGTRAHIHFDVVIQNLDAGILSGPPHTPDGGAMRGLDLEGAENVSVLRLRVLVAGFGGPSSAPASPPPAPRSTATSSATTRNGA